MILAEITKVEVANLTIGDKEFKEVKLIGEIGCFKQYGNENGYVVCIKMKDNFIEGVFSMFMQNANKDEPEQMAVVYATGEFAKASKAAPTQLDKLKQCLDIQKSDGNWNFDPYMHGMANGMIFALSTIEGTDPKYLDAPKEWIRDGEVEAEFPEMHETSKGQYGG